MLSHAPDQLLKGMLSVRESYLNKFKLNKSQHASENTDAFAKLVDVVTQDTIAKSFDEMDAKLTAIKTAAEIAQCELPIFEEAVNECKKSVDLGEAEPLQQKKEKSMRECNAKFREVCKSFSATLPFPTFASLKPQLQTFSATLSDRKPAGGLDDDFSKFHVNESNIHDYLLHTLDERIAFIDEYNVELRKFQTDAQVITTRFKMLLLQSIKKHMEEKAELQQQIIDTIKLDTADKVKQQYANLPPMDKEHEALRQEVIASADMLHKAAIDSIHARQGNALADRIPSKIKLGDSPSRKPEKGRDSPSSSESGDEREQRSAYASQRMYQPADSSKKKPEVLSQSQPKCCVIM